MRRGSSKKKSSRGPFNWDSHLTGETSALHYGHKGPSGAGRPSGSGGLPCCPEVGKARGEAASRASDGRCQARETRGHVGWGGLSGEALSRAGLPVPRPRLLAGGYGSCSLGPRVLFAECCVCHPVDSLCGRRSSPGLGPMPRPWTSHSAAFTFLTRNVKVWGKREVISLREEFRSPHG